MKISRNIYLSIWVSRFNKNSEYVGCEFIVQNPLSQASVVVLVQSSILNDVYLTCKNVSTWGTQCTNHILTQKSELSPIEM